MVYYRILNIVRNGNPLQYSCLESSIDRETFRATVHGVAELDTTEQPALTLTEYSLL